MTASPQPTDGREALLPCPFCGGEAKLEIGNNNFEDAQIFCQICGTQGQNFDNDEAVGAFSSDPKADAVKHWNTRSTSRVEAPVHQPTSPSVDADGEMIERVENILRSKKTVSYPSYAAAEYVREQLQELLSAYLRLRKQIGGEK